jgi:hypothetical protein
MSYPTIRRDGKGQTEYERRNPKSRTTGVKRNVSKRTQKER